ncbi:MAG: hypothetical protein K2Z81_10750, partial [Cyanobacteria bacterium]|nr:hypothetical protein [Cyanobacteriota bacterium]
ALGVLIGRSPTDKGGGEDFTVTSGLVSGFDWYVLSWPREGTTQTIVVKRTASSRLLEGLTVI